MIDIKSDRNNTKREEWYSLYSDAQTVAYHSGIKLVNGEKCADVMVDWIVYFDEHTQKRETFSFIVRLPGGKVVNIKDNSNPNFVLEDLDDEDFDEIMDRIKRDRTTILALAEKVGDPNHTEEELNFLRDKIDGKIYRGMPVECPYCGKLLTGERAKCTVTVPVSFYMHAGNLGIHEEEAYQAVTEAVQAGNIAGECLHCGHVLTAEDIEKHKFGWQYRWRYDPHK